MDFNQKTKALSGTATGKHYYMLKELYEKHSITGTMIMKKGIEKYAEEFNINVDDKVQNA